MPANTTSDDELTGQLLDLLTKNGAALPYLFIGSGISRRYLDLPDWLGLLRVFAEEADENFDFHLASANGEPSLAASSIAARFHNIWWNDDKYAAQRVEFAESVKDVGGGLKVAISDYIKDHQRLESGKPGVDDVHLARELDLLRKSVLDGVITTNYDSLTDQLFDTFKPYVGQDGLLLSDAQFIAEVYKIHGSAQTPSTLVLTAEDYERFSQRNHYLAAKLLTIFAEHPVLFVGYSINDKYIEEILDNIVTAVGPGRIDEISERIFFVEWNPDASSEATIEQSSLVRGGTRLPITRISTHSLEWVWATLTKLERPFPAAVLRELRNYVYELVTDPDPSQTREVVRAIPIDADGADKYRVVFGVGAFTEKDLQDLTSISGRTLQRSDLEQDVLGLRKRLLDAESVLMRGIPESIRPTSRDHLPVHKYLLECGRIAPDGTVNYAGLPAIIEKLAEKSIDVGTYSRTRFERDIRGKLDTPQKIASAPDLATYFKLDALVLLEPGGYNIDEFGEVLVGLVESGEAAKNLAGFRKAVCQFDRQKSTLHATGGQ